MMHGPIRLRERRSVHARRRNGRWRLATAGGVFAVLIGAACLAPLAPAALAPAESAEPIAVVPTVTARGASTVAVTPPKIAVLAPAATATPAPTLVPPTPIVVPTLTAHGLAALDAIRSDRTAQWVKTTADTPLRSGPTDTSTVFTVLPQWSLLKQTGSQPDWLMVQYSGDGATREAGPGWVKAGDVGAVDPPTVWLTSAKPATLWSSSGTRVLDVPAAALMEVQSGADFITGTRVHVQLPGNGRDVPPADGWVDGDSVARAAAPAFTQIPRAFPDDIKANVRINVPYRTQLDGSDFASANCGPTVLGMALESFGLNEPPPDLRGEVLDTENFDPNDTDAGSYIWALADVARSYGIHAQGLYDADGSLHHWTTDEIRASVERGQPVIVQVIYRGLPGREDSLYYGDHYIIVTGLMGDQFLYNDPIGGTPAHEAPGFDRVITPTQLTHAMHASDTEYAFSAFGLSKN